MSHYEDVFCLARNFPTIQEYQFGCWRFNDTGLVSNGLYVIRLCNQITQITLEKCVITLSRIT